MSSPPLDALSAAAAVDVDSKRRTAQPKTFQCRGFGDCHMVFSRAEHLARHKRKHTGERPFRCHCSKQFSRLDNLRQHAQTVHADKPGENERMMRDLTSLHASISAASRGNGARASRRSQPSTALSSSSIPSSATAAAALAAAASSTAPITALAGGPGGLSAVPAAVSPSTSISSVKLEETSQHQFQQSPHSRPGTSMGYEALPPPLLPLQQHGLQLTDLHYQDQSPPTTSSPFETSNSPSHISFAAAVDPFSRTNAQISPHLLPLQTAHSGLQQGPASAPPLATAPSVMATTSTTITSGATQQQPQSLHVPVLRRPRPTHLDLSRLSPNSSAQHFIDRSYPLTHSPHMLHSNSYFPFHLDGPELRPPRSASALGVHMATLTPPIPLHQQQQPATDWLAAVPHRQQLQLPHQQATATATTTPNFPYHHQGGNDSSWPQSTTTVMRKEETMTPPSFSTHLPSPSLSMDLASPAAAVPRANDRQTSLMLTMTTTGANPDRSHGDSPLWNSSTKMVHARSTSAEVFTGFQRHPQQGYRGPEQGELLTTFSTENRAPTAAGAVGVSLHSHPLPQLALHRATSQDLSPPPVLSRPPLISRSTIAGTSPATATVGGGSSFNAIAYSQDLARQQAQQLQLLAPNTGHSSTITSNNNNNNMNGATTGVGQGQLGDYQHHHPLHPLSHLPRQPHPSSAGVQVAQLHQQHQHQQHTLSAHPSHQAQGPHLLTRQVSLPHLHHLHQVQGVHDVSPASAGGFFHQQQQLQHQHQHQQQASQTQHELDEMDMIGFHHHHHHHQHAGSMDMGQQQQQHISDNASFGGDHGFMAHYHHPSMDMDISGHLTGDMESMSFDAAFAMHLMNDGAGEAADAGSGGDGGGGGHSELLG